MALFSNKKNSNPTKTSEEKNKKSAKEADAPAVISKPKKSFSHIDYLIVKPRVTEKTHNLSVLRQYVFEIKKNANKTEIKKAVERIYKVEVAAINIVNTPSKQRRLGRTLGKRSGFKKAIVSLKEGHSIDITPREEKN